MTYQTLKNCRLQFLTPPFNGYRDLTNSNKKVTFMSVTFIYIHVNHVFCTMFVAAMFFTYHGFSTTYQDKVGFPRIGRTSGYVVMLELMRRLAAAAEPPFGVATMNVPWEALVKLALEIDLKR